MLLRFQRLGGDRQYILQRSGWSRRVESSGELQINKTSQIIIYVAPAFWRSALRLAEQIIVGARSLEDGELAV